MHQGFKIFVVEENIGYCHLSAYHLSHNPDYEVIKMHSVQDCLFHLYENPAIVTLDYSLSDNKGVDLWQAIKSFNPAIQAIVILNQENVGTAVELSKAGAYNYIVRSEDTKGRLWNTVNNIRPTFLLKEEINSLKEELKAMYAFGLTGEDAIYDLPEHNLTLQDYTTRIIQHFLNINNGNIIITAKKPDIGKSKILKLVQERELQVS